MESLKPVVKRVIDIFQQYMRLLESCFLVKHDSFVVTKFILRQFWKHSNFTPAPRFTFQFFIFYFPLYHLLSSKLQFNLRPHRSPAFTSHLKLWGPLHTVVLPAFAPVVLEAILYFIRRCEQSSLQTGPRQRPVGTERLNPINLSISTGLLG